MLNMVNTEGILYMLEVSEKVGMYNKKGPAKHKFICFAGPCVIKLRFIDFYQSKIVTFTCWTP